MRLIIDFTTCDLVMVGGALGAGIDTRVKAEGRLDDGSPPAESE